MDEIISIRPAKLTDARAIFRVKSAARLASYGSIVSPAKLEAFKRSQRETPTKLRQWREKLSLRLNQENAIHLVLTENKVIVGYCAGRNEDGYLYVSQLHVLPGAQGKGFGKRLMTELMARAQGNEVCLHVARDNRAAKALYEKMGFIRREAGDREYFGAPMELMVKY